MRRRFSAQIVTGWAQTRVFDYIADFRNLIEWHPAVDRCELQSAEAVIRNARFLAHGSIAGRSVPARIVTLDLDRPQLIVASAENAAARTIDRFELGPDADGRTGLTYSVEMTVKVPLRVIGPLMVPGMTQTWEAAVGSLASLLEAEGVNVGSSGSA